MSSDLPLTPDDVAAIVAILDGSDYSQLDIRTARFRLRVAREGEGWTQSWEWSDEAVPAAAQAEETAAEALPEGLAAVPSPLPGTFYHAPQPGAPPFVAVGDRVAVDTVVGIVETMKLMNPVHAGVAGVVEAMVVPNATMVAKGQALLHVRPDGA